MPSTMRVTDDAVSRWRKPGWKTWAVVLVVVPLAAMWGGNRLLWTHYLPPGQGEVKHIPQGAAGGEAITWFQDGGVLLVVGVLALVLLLALRVHPLRALLMAALAAATVFPWWVVSTIVVLEITGGTLN